MEGLRDLSRDVLRRARLSRDARFDGKFFIAVTTTRIYCRPVCPARASKDSNVRYYATAAEAAEAGFRPCLRCRPEAAPGSPAWTGTSAVVRRALRLIQSGALDEGSVEELANRLGISGRHLTRLFALHVGASPAAVAQTRRLHFAKRLLDDTLLSVTEIAMASGFGSVRRFNDAVLDNYQRSPSELRRRHSSTRGVECAAEIILRLAYRPPYDWEHLHAFLLSRAIQGVEGADGDGYVRAARTTSGYAVVRVRPAEETNALELKIKGAQPSDLLPLLSSVRRMFDLSSDPARIAAALGGDPLLRPLLQLRPGLRIPGVWEPFECLVRAILSKQVSIAAARTRLGCLVQRLGQPIHTAEQGITHLFPGPDVIAKASLDDLGITGAQQNTLRLLARNVEEGSIRLDDPSDELARTLAELPGVGRWIAGYVALRGFGEPDAFPYGDLKLRLQAASHKRSLSAQELAARAARWRPFRGYAVLHFWEANAAARRLQLNGAR
jgi:AraC family transcriptional regulator of adaptative response / DNA-3-methyladenine glycosylase II